MNRAASCSACWGARGLGGGLRPLVFHAPFGDKGTPGLSGFLNTPAPPGDCQARPRVSGTPCRPARLRVGSSGWVKPVSHQIRSHPLADVHERHFRERGFSQSLLPHPLKVCGACGIRFCLWVEGLKAVCCMAWQRGRGKSRAPVPRAPGPRLERPRARARSSGGRCGGSTTRAPPSSSPPWGNQTPPTTTSSKRCPSLIAATGVSRGRRASGPSPCTLVPSEHGSADRRRGLIPSMRLPPLGPLDAQCTTTRSGRPTARC